MIKFITYINELCVTRTITDDYQLRKKYEKDNSSTTRLLRFKASSARDKRH